MNKHLKNYRAENFNGIKPSGIRSLANESGVALVMALLLMAVMMAMVPVALQMTSGDMDRTTDFKEDRQLFYLAEAGMEHGVALLKDSDLDTILAGPDGDPTTAGDNGTVAGVGDTADATPFTWMGTPYDDVAFGPDGGTYYFRVYDNDDGDGDLNVDADGLGFIESVGVSADGTTKIMRSMLHKVKIAMPPAAITVTGPTADIDFDTDTFTVHGVFPGTMNGYAIDGTEDPTCPGKNGIALEAPGPIEIKGDVFDPTDEDTGPCGGNACIRLQFDSDGSEIIGIGGGTPGNPDVVAGQTSLTSLDAAKLFNQLTVVETPDYVYDRYRPDTDVTFGSPAAPVVVYIEDELRVEANMTGYGILIVNEELEVDDPGFLNWYGIVIFGACPTCSDFEFEPDNAIIYGSVVVGGEDIEIEDNGIVRYSCAAIEMANGVFDNVFSVISWEEVS